MPLYAAIRRQEGREVTETIEAPNQASALALCRSKGWRYDGRICERQDDIATELRRLGLS